MERYKFFENMQCECYPCHRLERINCLFCYCPLYFVEDCGGDPTTTDKGIKDCSDCTRAHGEGGFDFVMQGIERENKRRLAEKKK